MSDTNLVQQAIDQAERSCQDAVETTPQEYRQFLIFIPQSKRVGGRNSNQYANIRLPYMGVDGRIKMAQDDHRNHQGTLSIHTEFMVEPHSQQLLCKATIESSLYGTYTAHSRVFIDGKGVDATNPAENGESSAIGRALGFMGYGLYGNGIASAEEVLNAIQAREDIDTEKRPVPDMSKPKEESSPVSERQRAFLRNLLSEQYRFPDTAIDTCLRQIDDSCDVQALLAVLREGIKSGNASPAKAIDILIRNLGTRVLESHVEARHQEKRDLIKTCMDAYPKCKELCQAYCQEVGISAFRYMTFADADTLLGQFHEWGLAELTRIADESGQQERLQEWIDAQGIDHMNNLPLINIHHKIKDLSAVAMAGKD